MTILPRSTIPLPPMFLKGIPCFSFEFLPQANVNVSVGFDWILNILNAPITNLLHMVRGKLMIPFHLKSSFEVFLPLGIIILNTPV